MGWLGWLVAGVLLVSAGGAALATQDATSTIQAPSGGVDKERGVSKARAGLRHARWRRALHGEVTVRTKDGTKTIIMARGEVTALTNDAITVKSSDGVETSFRIDGATRFGFRNEPDPRAELKVGEDAFVAGEKAGDSAVAKRVVSGELADRAAKRATP